MAIVNSFLQGSIISFSGTPTITIEKFNSKNYRAWLESVELWFLGQGFHDHLKKQEAEILEENRVPWLKPAIPSGRTLEMSSLMMFNVYLIQLRDCFSSTDQS
ncbi:hypothetical protein CR513_53214, partial [Mucuna pruriens]